MEHIEYNHEAHRVRRPVIRIFRIVGFAVLGLFFAAFLGLAFGYFVKLLWNWLMPSLFALRAITYWEAFGIVILAKILFGGFGPHQDHHPRENAGKRAKSSMFRWIGLDEEKWMPGGSYDNWKYYNEYWETEGKSAFESYLARIKTEKERK